MSSNSILVPYLLVIKNVELPLIVKGISSKDRREKVLQLLDEVGLRDKAFSRPTRLSGGEQQRVAIARALINNPEILLADKPTGNLDSKNSIMIAELFRKLNEKGRTIVMVTHNLEVALYAKRILLDNLSTRPYLYISRHDGDNIKFQVISVKCRS